MAFTSAEFSDRPSIVRCTSYRTGSTGAASRRRAPIRRCSRSGWSLAGVSGRAENLHSLRPTRDGDDAGARDFDQADRQHQVDEAFDLVGGAGDLEHEAFGGGIDD